MHFWLYVSSHNNFIALALEFCGRPNIHTFTYTYIVSIETVFCNATKREKGVGNVQMYAHRHTYTAWECCMNSSSFVANISSESLPCIFVPHSLLRWDPENEKISNYCSMSTLHLYEISSVCCVMFILSFMIIHKECYINILRKTKHF